MLLVCFELLRVVRSCPAVLLRVCMHVQHNLQATCCGVQVQSRTVLSLYRNCGEHRAAHDLLLSPSAGGSVLVHNSSACRSSAAWRHQRVVVLDCPATVAGLRQVLGGCFSGLQGGLAVWLAPPSMHHCSGTAAAAGHTLQLWWVPPISNADCLEDQPFMHRLRGGASLCVYRQAG